MGGIFVVDRMTKNHQPLKNQQKLQKPAKTLDRPLISESKKIDESQLLPNTSTLELSRVKTM